MKRVYRRSSIPRLCLEASKCDDQMIGFRSQMYVELEGDESQSGNLPSFVFLELRHLSASYFRDGLGDTKKFRQPLGAKRKFKFNRFSITNTNKCREEQIKGNRKYQTGRTRRGLEMNSLHWNINCTAASIWSRTGSDIILVAAGAAPV